MTQQTEQPRWHRAKRCGSAACIEVAKIGNDRYLIRDSKNPDAAPLEFTGEEWTAFTRGLEEGDFPA